MTQTPWRVLGGPLGAHTSPRLRSTAGWARLAALLAALPVLAALALRSWCLSNGFGGQAPLWRACYSDLPAALGAIRLGDAVGEPVVTALALEAVAAVVRGTDAGAMSTYVVVWGLVSLVAVAMLAVAVAAYRIDQPDRALLLVLSPVLPLTLLISADIAGVTLAVLGLLALRRRLDILSGVLLALAVFSRSYALIVVVVVLAGTVGSGRDPRRFLAGLAGGTAVVVALAAALGPTILTEPLRRWWETSPSYGSVWLLPTFAGAPIPQGVAPWLALAGWLVAAALVVWVVRAAPRAPALADVALIGVAAVLVTSTAVPVQASLWLVPLVALSSLPWRDMLIWAGAEALYYPMVWLYIGGLERADRGLPAGWYAFFLLLRLSGIAYLGYRALEGARYPDVPASEEDIERDKSAGVWPSRPSSPQPGQAGGGPGPWTAD
ncbi:MAG: hypothetical protein ABR500_06400 [Dermatophilaceae bacterium]|nr:hypothetical protein [Intrasporangiaceae bacterium]